MQISSQIVTTNKPTPSFLQAGCPSCHPTNSVRALKWELLHYYKIRNIPTILIIFPTCQSFDASFNCVRIRQTVYHGNGRIQLWNVDTGRIPTVVRLVVDGRRQIDNWLLSVRVEKIQSVTCSSDTRSAVIHKRRPHQKWTKGGGGLASADVRNV